MKWSQNITRMLAGLLISTSATAANDSLVRSSLEEIRAAHEQTRYLMQSNLPPTEKERIRYIDMRLLSATDLLRNSLNNPGNPPPYPPPASAVELYHSDRCTSDLIGRVSNTTNCQDAFAGAATTWGVKIDGQCMDISDISSIKACELFKGASTTSGVKIYHSDRCSSDLLAIVSYATDCQTLAGLPAAWGIESNGQCTDISDMSAVAACERFKQ